MAVYVIALLEFIDEPAYRRYQAEFGKVFSRFDGKVLAADEAPSMLEGERCPDKIVVLEFVTRDEAIRFTCDPDYLRISKDRQAGAVTLSLLASGLQHDEPISQTPQTGVIPRRDNTNPCAPAQAGA